jgi:hypothetical protein
MATAAQKKKAKAEEEAKKVASQQIMNQGGEAFAEETANEILGENKPDVTEKPPVVDVESENSIDVSDLAAMAIGTKAIKESFEDNAESEAPAKKTLSNSANDTVSDNVSDVVLMGVNVNNWRLLCKAYSVKEGWMKSTKALDISGDIVLVQTTTQQTNHDGSYALTDTLIQMKGRLVESAEKGIFRVVS